MTPASFSQRPHFSRFAFATSSSEAETVSPMSLTGLDTASLLPGDTATAGASASAFSSPVMGNVSSCGGVESRHAPMLMLGDGGKPKTGPTSLLLLRTGAFRGRGILVGAEQSTPSPALKHKLPSLAGLASGPHEHPWSPDSDPPPMCDEENPTFGNNPNKPQALT